MLPSVCGEFGDSPCRHASVSSQSALLSALERDVVTEIHANHIFDQRAPSSAECADLARALTANVAATALSFEGCPASFLVIAAKALSQKPALESLVLRDVEGSVRRCVGMAATSSTLHAPSALRCLVLNGFCPSDAAWSSAAKLLALSPSLRSLRLEGGYVGDACGRQVAAALLSPHAGLRSLALVGYRLGDTAGQALAAALRPGGSQLQSLTFNGLGTTDTTGVALAKVLTRNESLRSLTLEGTQPFMRGCHMSDQTGLAMADMLHHNTGLQSLTLRGSRMGDATGVAVARALRHNETLRRLQLWGFAVGDRTGTALASSLRQRSAAILGLTLEGGCISDKTGTALAETLRQEASKLQHLAVDGTGITASTGIALVTALSENTALISLTLSPSVMRGSVWLHAEQVLHQNISLRVFALRAAGHNIATSLRGRRGDRIQIGAARTNVEKSLRRNRSLLAQWLALCCLARVGTHGESLHCLFPPEGGLQFALTEPGFQRVIFSFFLPPHILRGADGRSRSEVGFVLPPHFHGGLQVGCGYGDNRKVTLSSGYGGH
eukprot:TRINITY_DN9312_c0_g2_i1.p1 TRINITY_DN9312_c0_g2~~TRINITY_DN9312_c0_g2_i1.p1  ORF type:complete len:555 (+),score=81.96 TRINITY_DN9312_c0_g2_i1:48-1712(+)